MRCVEKTPAFPASRAHRSAPRTRRNIHVANATPDVAQMLRDLDLGWLVEGRPLPELAPANDRMALTPVKP